MAFKKKAIAPEIRAKIEGVGSSSDYVFGKAITDYDQLGSKTGVNSFLRELTTEMDLSSSSIDDSFRARIAFDLQKDLLASPSKPMTTYRAVAEDLGGFQFGFKPSPDAPKNLAEKINLDPKKVFYDKGFLATAGDADYANRHGKDIRFEVMGSAGYKMPTRHADMGGEVLYPAGNQFDVENYRVNPEAGEITARLIDRNLAPDEVVRLKREVVKPVGMWLTKDPALFFKEQAKTIQDARDLGLFTRRYLDDIVPRMNQYMSTEEFKILGRKSEAYQRILKSVSELDNDVRQRFPSNRASFTQRFNIFNHFDPTPRQTVRDSFKPSVRALRSIGDYTGKFQESSVSLGGSLGSLNGFEYGQKFVSSKTGAVGSLVSADYASAKLLTLSGKLVDFSVPEFHALQIKPPATLTDLKRGDGLIANASDQRYTVMETTPDAVKLRGEDGNIKTARLSDVPDKFRANSLGFSTPAVLTTMLGATVGTGLGYAFARKFAKEAGLDETQQNIAGFAGGVLGGSTGIVLGALPALGDKEVRSRSFRMPIAKEVATNLMLGGNAVAQSRYGKKFDEIGSVDPPKVGGARTWMPDMNRAEQLETFISTIASESTAKPPKLTSDIIADYLDRMGGSATLVKPDGSQYNPNRKGRVVIGDRMTLAEKYGQAGDIGLNNEFTKLPEVHARFDDRMTALQVQKEIATGKLTTQKFFEVPTKEIANQAADEIRRSPEIQLGRGENIEVRKSSGGFEVVAVKQYEPIPSRGNTLAREYGLENDATGRYVAFNKPEEAYKAPKSLKELQAESRRLEASGTKAIAPDTRTEFKPQVQEGWQKLEVPARSPMFDQVVNQVKATVDPLPRLQSSAMRPELAEAYKSFGLTPNATMQDLEAKASIKDILSWDEDSAIKSQYREVYRDIKSKIVPVIDDTFREAARFNAIANYGSKAEGLSISKTGSDSGGWANARGYEGEPSLAGRTYAPRLEDSRFAAEMGLAPFSGNDYTQAKANYDRYQAAGFAPKASFPSLDEIKTQAAIEGVRSEALPNYIKGKVAAPLIEAGIIAKPELPMTARIGQEYISPKTGAIGTVESVGTKGVKLNVDNQVIPVEYKTLEKLKYTGNKQYGFVLPELLTFQVGIMGGAVIGNLGARAWAKNAGLNEDQQNIAAGVGTVVGGITGGVAGIAPFASSSQLATATSRTFKMPSAQRLLASAIGAAPPVSFMQMTGANTMMSAPQQRSAGASSQSGAIYIPDRQKELLDLTNQKFEQLRSQPIIKPEPVAKVAKLSLETDRIGGYQPKQVPKILEALNDETTYRAVLGSMSVADQERFNSGLQAIEEGQKFGNRDLLATLNKARRDVPTLGGDMYAQDARQAFSQLDDVLGVKFGFNKTLKFGLNEFANSGNAKTYRVDIPDQAKIELSRVNVDGKSAFRVDNIVAYNPDAVGDRFAIKTLGYLQENLPKPVVMGNVINEKLGRIFEKQGFVKQGNDYLPPELVTVKQSPTLAELTGDRFVSYHGSSSPVADLKNDFFNKDNIYGNGFYTTQDKSIAETYRVKGASTDSGKGYLYEVEAKNRKLFNLDDAISPQIKDAVISNAADSGRLAVLHKEAERLINGGKSVGLGGKAPVSTTELFDGVRKFSKRVQVEIGEDGYAKFVDSFKPSLQKEGYVGFTHEGGVLTKGKRHQVDIFWEPETSVKLTQLDGSASSELNIVKTSPSSVIAEAPKSAPTLSELTGDRELTPQQFAKKFPDRAKPMGRTSLAEYGIDMRDFPETPKPVAKDISQGIGYGALERPVTIEEKKYAANRQVEIKSRYDNASPDLLKVGSFARSESGLTSKVVGVYPDYVKLQLPDGDFIELDRGAYLQNYSPDRSYSDVKPSTKSTAKSKSGFMQALDYVTDALYEPKKSSGGFNKQQPKQGTFIAESSVEAAAKSSGATTAQVKAQIANQRATGQAPDLAKATEAIAAVRSLAEMKTQSKELSTRVLSRQQSDGMIVTPSESMINAGMKQQRVKIGDRIGASGIGIFMDTAQAAYFLTESAGRGEKTPVALARAGISVGAGYATTAAASFILNPYLRTAAQIGGGIAAVIGADKAIDQVVGRNQATEQKFAKDLSKLDLQATNEKDQWKPFANDSNIAAAYGNSLTAQVQLNLDYRPAARSLANLSNSQSIDLSRYASERGESIQANQSVGAGRRNMTNKTSTVYRDRGDGITEAIGRRRAFTDTESRVLALQNLVNESGYEVARTGKFDPKLNEALEKLGYSDRQVGEYIQGRSKNIGNPQVGTDKSNQDKAREIMVKRANDGKPKLTSAELSQALSDERKNQGLKYGQMLSDTAVAGVYSGLTGKSLTELRGNKVGGVKTQSALRIGSGIGR